MRDKRRAIGRSIAAAMTDMGTRVDEELVFLRAIDNLDAPHFRLLWMMAEISIWGKPFQLPAYVGGDLPVSES